MRSSNVGRMAGVLAAALWGMVAAAQGLPPPPTWVAEPHSSSNNQPAETPPPAASQPASPAPSSEAPLAKASPPPARVIAPQPVAPPANRVVTTSAAVDTSAHRAPAGNTVVLRNRGRETLHQYPLQFARPFVQGEIANSPQVLIDGTPVPTQADVMMRYADHSVKHAVISVIVPALPADKPVTLTFKDQPNDAESKIDIADLLSDKFDFDASFEFSNKVFAPGQVFNISARDMLKKAGSCSESVLKNPTALCSYWTKGPIATTIILADHSPKRAYDLGFTSNRRAVRPIFHVTFWPTINRVRVRYIAEIANISSLQDEFYDVSLKIGEHDSKSVYSKSLFAHHYGTRWTKTFWIGDQLEEKIDIDNNFPYLISTKIFPNYNLDHPVGSNLEEEWTLWQKKTKDIGDNGFWEREMPTVGGRWDIGHIPRWTLLWLYTGDWRAREVAFTQADLAGNWAMHAREAEPAKKLDKAQHVSDLGRMLTPYSRPTLWLYDDRGTPAAGDAVTVSNPPGLMMVDGAGKPFLNFGRRRWPAANDPNYHWVDARFAQFSASYFDDWHADGAHQPDPYFSEYLLSGDYWYLEQLQQWAGTMSVKFCAAVAAWCRGPGGGIHDEVRGEAWVLRNRVNAAFASPDDSPEKAVLGSLVDDAVARWEGQRNITGTPLHQTAMWKFGFENAGNMYGSPLHFWRVEDHREGLVTAPAPDTIEIGGATSPWMNNYLLMELGRATELGFSTQAVWAWAGQNLIGQLTDPGFNPYLVAAYHMPVTKKDGAYFTSWSELLKGFPVGSATEIRTQRQATLYQDPTYLSIARAAASQCTELPNGPAAWQRINAMAAPQLGIMDVVWDMLPRHH